MSIIKSSSSWNNAKAAISNVWNTLTRPQSGLIANANNTGQRVYGLLGPINNAPRANGNYQRYLQHTSSNPIARAASGLPAVDTSSPALTSEAGSPSSPPTSEGFYDQNGTFWPAQAAYGYLSNIGNSSAKSWDYTNADIAKQYGMSKETAYQEAMANTAYQRSVKDLQDAGLNPAALFGAGRVSGADGVAYVTDSSAGAYGYTAAQSGSGYSRASGKSSYALTNSQYNLYKLLGMGLGFAATRKWYGAVAGGNVAVQLMRLYNGLSQDK